MSRLFLKATSRTIAPLFAAALLTACGGGAADGGGAEAPKGGKAGDGDGAAADAGGGDASITVSAGAKVCIQTTIGQRYLVEEALEEASFELVDSCMTADVILEELGEPGAFELKYQKVGGEEWESCKSELDDQRMFLSGCISEMKGG